jgi:Protein of unknown function (DUF1569)
MAINTGKVTGRRELHYANFDEVLADAERLAAGPVQVLGNWTYGQILEHLATALEMSIDGFNAKAPWYIRLVAGLFLRRRFIYGAMTPGFKLPKPMSGLLPKEASVAQGLAHLRRAVERLNAEETRSPHPVFTKLTREESDQIQLRHCELHLSFVLPA